MGCCCANRNDDALRKYLAEQYETLASAIEDAGISDHSSRGLQVVVVSGPIRINAVILIE